ncbi:MAG TPA: hypothetical protein VM032_19290 [Vicinamibacterales bacterium]|nr:hypothetical protein [Vicinamibacterales bacterium]
MRSAIAAALAAALIVPLCAAPPLPERLSETGLYVRGSLDVDPRNRTFAPQYPLWTDGAAKSRWVWMPPGATIDAHDVDRWIFPVGTRLWKEFSFNGRKVETRMMWRASAGAWSYASYLWNDAQTDATLAPAEGVRAVAPVAPGRRHSIPSREDCRTCHENGITPVLGFTALQLSADRDPSAPHAEALQPGMVTVRTLVAERWLEPSHPELASRPPRIAGDPRTRAALGYLTANCGHCHNEQSPVATVRYPMLMPTFASPEQVRRSLDVLFTRPTTWESPQAEPAPPG